MLQKIICIFFLIFILPFSVSAADCKYNVGDDIWIALDECLKDAAVVSLQANENLKADSENWIKKVVKRFSGVIANILGVVAIGAIAFGWFSMVMSGWEDEKLKKAKDIIKWAIVGLVGILLAEQILNAISNLI